MSIPSLIQDVQKRFGADAIMSMSAYGSTEKLTFVSSGSFSVDYVIGRPGIPCGRIIEIYGPFSSGKSTIVATMLASFQNNGGHAIVVDSEHSYSAEWVSALGVKTDQLHVMQPPHLQAMFEQVAFLCSRIVESQVTVPVIIAVDSLSSFPTAEEIEFLEDKKASHDKKDPGRAIGLHARYCAKGLRILSDLIWKSNVAIVFVSQQKDNPMQLWGGGISKLGGAAVDFHAVVQLRTSKIKKEPTHIEVKLRCDKNKIAPPFKETQLSIVFGQGIDDTDTFIKAGLEKGIITAQQAGWYVNAATGAKARASDMVPQIAQQVYYAVFPEKAPKQEAPPPPEHPSDTVVEPNTTTESVADVSEVTSPAEETPKVDTPAIDSAPPSENPTT